MNPDENPTESPVQRTPRLWPLLAILVLQAITIGVSITPSINNAVRFGYMMIGPAVCVLLTIVWLLGFSRLPVRDKVSLLLAALLLPAATYAIIDKSMGVAMWIYGAPLSLLAIAIALLLVKRIPRLSRLGLTALFLFAIWATFSTLRLDGFMGDYLPQFAFRWSLQPISGAGVAAIKPAEKYAAWTPQEIEWPGFRGAACDGRATNISGAAEWSGEPNIVWRVPMGPAWSSFVLVSGRLFTQEQVGEEEAVTCLDAATGEIIWRTTFPCRFFDVVAGAGPRATPSYHEGRLYTFGGKAILACLDAKSGEIIWQRDLMKEVNAQLPVWGFSSSPLIIGTLAIVYAGGDGDNGLIAYDQKSGEPVWRMASGGMNFSSAQTVKFAEKDLVLFGDGNGLTALEPATGAIAWKFKPEAWNGPAICQPQQIDGESLLIPLGDGIGLARLKVSQTDNVWKVEPVWTAKDFKPSFNDFVYHKGYCYGFDNNAFACLDAETGTVKWKHRGYGFGQVVLLADIDRLVVASEKGKAILLAANPDAHQELGSVPLIKGKTWNHPIAVGQRLYMRNGEEAVALDLQ